jgi:cupin fold WbuC family metalloprotein
MTDNGKNLIKTKFLTPEAMEADIPIVHVGQPEIDSMKGKVRSVPRKRIRLCAHKGAADALHEMFVVYVKETYVRPNKHIGKDESLHIIEGAADFVFFDPQGKIIEVVPLGDYRSGRRFYTRIPEEVYHTFIIHSDVIVIHETIEGPFDRATTEFASWAPEEGDAPGIAKYMAQLAKDSAPFLKKY